jgi:hypothetical protein
MGSGSSSRKQTADKSVEVSPVKPIPPRKRHKHTQTKKDWPLQCPLSIIDLKDLEKIVDDVTFLDDLVIDDNEVRDELNVYCFFFIPRLRGSKISLAVFSSKHKEIENS